MKLVITPYRDGIILQVVNDENGTLSSVKIDPDDKEMEKLVSIIYRKTQKRIEINCTQSHVYKEGF